MAVSRYRDQFNRAVLIAGLERAVNRGTIEDYCIKGGAAIELRFGALARATRDLDIELPVSLDKLRATFAAALTEVAEDFRFSVSDVARAIREDALRVEVSVYYLDRQWATIDVDLAPATAAHAVESIVLQPSDLASVASAARTMRPEFLIAQKIHAVLTPDTPDYEFAYARHVVDIVFLAQTRVDINLVRSACHAVFELRSARDGRHWPPSDLALPTRWLADYPATVQQYPNFDVNPKDIPALFERFLVTLIGGSQSVPGYEYQFNVIPFRSPEGAQDKAWGLPIDSETSGFRGFKDSSARGWRLRTAVEITGRIGKPELLLILEREVRDEPET